MSQYFPKPFRSLRGSINVKVDLSNYAAKTDLKNVTRSYFNVRKNIFACLFSINNTISLSCHEQVCLSGLHFERYFCHHPAT